jgi:hypothetical protein
VAQDARVVVKQLDEDIAPEPAQRLALLEHRGSVAGGLATISNAALLHEAMAIRGEMDIESYDRLFPAQDYLPRRGFGNLIALPLEGRCRQNRTTLFVDPATFEPYRDQFAYLSSLERMTRRDVVERRRASAAHGRSCRATA